MRLIVVRHGETQWNECRRLQGISETELTPRGQRQARSIGRRLSKMRVDSVISSPLQRAWDTAQQIARAGRYPLEKESALCEMNFGVWEGKTFDEISVEYPQTYQTWSESPDRCRSSEDAEMIGEVWEKLDQLLAGLLHSNGRACHVLVTHTIPAKLLIASCIGLPFSKLHSLRLENASMSIIDWNQGYKMLRLMNDVSHLREPGRWKKEKSGP